MSSLKGYPANWKTVIRPRILARAQNKCERCGLPNHSTIIRSLDDGDDYLILNSLSIWETPDGTWVRMSEMPEEFEAQPRTTKVVLTIAHLDHDITHNTDDNLQALCQRCHLLHDGELHARHAAETRRCKMEVATGQMRLIE